MVAAVDVIIITALKEELDALLEVTAGLVEPWHDGLEGDVPHHLATFEGQHGPVRMAAARLTQMGGVATAMAATRLAEVLTPGCLAMCGVCAGHPEDTELGDVVIADRVFHHDQGKLRAGALEGDLWIHSLNARWLHAAQDLAGPAKGFHGYATADDETGQWWFIEQLLAGRDPMRSVALRRHVPDTRRTAILEALRDKRGYVAFTGGAFALTEAGRDAGQEHRVFHGTLVTQRPYHIHVGPMGSGNAVIADGVIWDRLAANQGMRKTLAVEMEAASVGQIAHQRSLPFVVVKGVMDHADQGKDDRFKAFAARVSAEVLLGLLRRVVMTSVPPEHREGPPSERQGTAPIPTIDNRGANIGQQFVINGDANFGAMTITMPGAASHPPQPDAALPVEEDVGEVDDERLTNELAKVFWDPERARDVKALSAAVLPLLAMVISCDSAKSQPKARPSVGRAEAKPAVDEAKPAVDEAKPVSEVAPDATPVEMTQWKALKGKKGMSKRWGSAWIDIKPPRNFQEGAEFRIALGGDAACVAVRLLADGGDHDEPDGMVGEYEVPNNRRVIARLDEDRDKITHLSVHGKYPWDTYCSPGNGSAMIKKVEYREPKS